MLFSVIWAAGLAIGSLLPGGSALATSVEQFNLFGFGLHLIGYALFATILILTFRYHLRHHHYLVYAVVIAATYGLILELLQMLVPNRDPSVVDAVVNAMGAFITATIYQIKYGRTQVVAQG